MKVHNFPFSFTYQRQKMLGQCQSFKIQKRHQFRVVLQNQSNGEQPDVFILYWLKNEKRFFWFELPDKWKESMSATIAVALKQYLKVHPEIV